MHISMFKASKDHGYIQCIINADHKKDFEALGFVDHGDKIEKKESKKTKKVKADDSNKG